MPVLDANRPVHPRIAELFVRDEILVIAQKHEDSQNKIKKKSSALKASTAENISFSVK